MASDGTLKFDTKIDTSGFKNGTQEINDIAKSELKSTNEVTKSGISNLSTIAQKGVSGFGTVAKAGLEITAKALTGTVTGIAALGTASIKVGSDFEAGMSKVQATSGASAEDLERLKNKAKEMGASTKFSATESAEALNYMAMAGWKTEDMLGGLEGIMNLAAASGEDLAITSDIVTDAITAFGLTAEDATHFADVLASTSSNANTNVGLLGETFKYVAPLAGSMSYSVEDTSLAIGLMANAGIKGSQAGTSLRATLTRLAKPTKDSQAAMEDLGISITNSDGSMRPLIDVIGDMRTGFAGLTEAEQTNYAAMLGGQEAMSGLLAIVNASDADFEKLSSAINNCNGSAAEMAEIMQDNLQGQVTIFKSALEGLGISIYETMQGTAKDVVKEANSMLDQLQTAFNEGGLTGLVDTFGNVLAQIVQRVAEEAPKLINAAVDLITSFCDGLKNAPGIGESAANLITSLITGLLSSVGTLWSTAITLIGELASGLAEGAPQMIQAGTDTITNILDAIVANLPMILQAGIDILLALVNGVAQALPTLITQGAEIVNQITTTLSDNLPALIDAALGLVDGLVQGLVEGIPILLDGSLQLFEAIIEAIPTVIDKLLQALPDLITTIIDFFVDNIPMIVDGSITLLMGIIEAIPQIIQAIVDNLPQIITALVEGLVGALPQLIEASVTLLMAIIKAIPEIITAIAENLPQIITAIATGLADAMPEIFTAARDLLWEIIKAIPEIVIGLAEAVPDIVMGIVNGLVGGLSAVKDAALELGSGILDGIKSFFGINSPSTVMTEQGGYLVQGLVNGIADMPNELAQYLDDTIQRVMAWGQQMLSNAQTSIQTMVDKVTNQVSQLPGKLWTWLVNVVTRVNQWGQQMLTTAKTAIDNMISSVNNLFAQLPGKIKNWLDNIITKLNAWGQDMINNARNAINNMISSINNLLTELPGKVKRWLDNVITNLAQWNAEMTAKGIAAAKGLFDAVVNGLSSLPAKMAEIGSDIITGIWNGISNGWEWLKGKVADLANSLLDAAKEKLGIDSPSKAFRDDFGRWLMPGALEGIEDSMPQALRTIKGQAGELLASMQGAVNASMSNVMLQVSGQTNALATTAGTIIYDNHTETQENNYHVPVVNKSEVAREKRELFRNMIGGVK